MAWNEPGGGKDKNPWSGDGGNKNNGGGPPDLDEIWRRLRSKFTGNKRGSGRGGPGGGGSGSIGNGLIFIAAVVVIAVWLFTGLYVVQPGEKGVLLHFGKYVQTVGPGWHWRLPYPIGAVYKVDTQKVRTASSRSVMLTKHENYVAVGVSVQYRVSNAMHYLFRLREPDHTVLQVLRSVVREIVGNSAMNQVIQEGVDINNLKTKAEEKVDLKKSTGVEKPEKPPLANVKESLVREIKHQEHNQPEITNRSRATLHKNIRRLMQYRLNQYEAGIEIVAVNVKYAQPPEPVQGAFEEAIKAREQKVTKKNKARAYARALVARAQGEKAQQIAKAKAYKQRKIQRAKGEAARFTKVVHQYEKAPRITRDRLYYETMGEVLGQSHLILNSSDQNSMNYLPLNQLLSSKTESQKSQQSSNNSHGGSKQGSSISNNSNTLPAQSRSSGNMGNNSHDNYRNRNRKR